MAGNFFFLSHAQQYSSNCDAHQSERNTNENSSQAVKNGRRRRRRECESTVATAAGSSYRRHFQSHRHLLLRPPSSLLHEPQQLFCLIGRCGRRRSAGACDHHLIRHPWNFLFANNVLLQMHSWCPLLHSCPISRWWFSFQNFVRKLTALLRKLMHKTCCCSPPPPPETIRRSSFVQLLGARGSSSGLNSFSDETGNFVVHNQQTNKQSLNSSHDPSPCRYTHNRRPQQQQQQTIRVSWFQGFFGFFFEWVVAM